jgi:hypothetical protein
MLCGCAPDQRRRCRPAQACQKDGEVRSEGKSAVCSFVSSAASLTGSLCRCSSQPASQLSSLLSEVKLTVEPDEVSKACSDAIFQTLLLTRQVRLSGPAPSCQASALMRCAVLGPARLSMIASQSMGGGGLVGSSLCLLDFVWPGPVGALHAADSASRSPASWSSAPGFPCAA